MQLLSSKSRLSRYIYIHPLIRKCKTNDSQYFKSIEAVASSQGFEQILPSTVRTGPRTAEKQHIEPVPEVNGEAPSILSPKPTTSTLLSAPATEYPVRSHTPELVPDRMGSRITA